MQEICILPAHANKFGVSSLKFYLYIALWICRLILRNVVEFEELLDWMGWCSGKNLGLYSQDNRVRISKIKGCPDCGVLFYLPSLRENLRMLS